MTCSGVCVCVVKTTVQNGWTALHLACWKGYLEIVGLLICSGCDINIGTNVRIFISFLSLCEVCVRDVV